MKRINTLFLVGMLVLIGSSTCFASVLPRFSLSSGTRYNYDLELIDTIELAGDTVETTLTTVVTRDVEDFNATYKLITTEVSDCSWVMRKEGEVWFEDTLDDQELLVEKFDTRGFVRGDIECRNDLFDLGDDVFDMNDMDNKVKPFLSGLFITELPPDSMNVNDTWTLDHTWLLGEMNNIPTTHICWRLLSESETHLGIDCAKFEITTPNSTFSNLNGVPGEYDPSITWNIDDYDITTFNLSGTLWFDLTGGKIVEWDVDIQYDGTVTVDDGTETTMVTIDKDTSLNYQFTGTE